MKRARCFYQLSRHCFESFYGMIFTSGNTRLRQTHFALRKDCNKANDFIELTNVLHRAWLCVQSMTIDEKKKQSELCGNVRRGMTLRNTNVRQWRMILLRSLVTAFQNQTRFVYQGAWSRQACVRNWNISIERSAETDHAASWTFTDQKNGTG